MTEPPTHYYILVARDANERMIARTASTGSLEGNARKMCHEIMRLLGNVTHVDVYDYQPGLDLSTGTPIETVRRREGEEGQG